MMRKKILLIDDDEDLLRSFQVILESNGFDAIICNEATNGFLMLKKDTPDLLVLDVMMKTDLEGYELLQEIKRDPEYKEMPVIMLTGIRDQLGINLFSTVEKGSLFSNVRFQDKPINPHVLVAMIGDMLKACDTI